MCVGGRTWVIGDIEGTWVWTCLRVGGVYVSVCRHTGVLLGVGCREHGDSCECVQEWLCLGAECFVRRCAAGCPEPVDMLHKCVAE